VVGIPGSGQSKSVSSESRDGAGPLLKKVHCSRAGCLAAFRAFSSSHSIGKMVYMNHPVTKSIAIGVVLGVVAGTLHGEDQPHVEYITTASVNSNLAASGGFALTNSSSQFVTTHAAPLTLEQLLPRDHLVVQTAALVTPPTSKVVRTAVFTSGTGPDPFFMRRPRASRSAVLVPNVKPF
jgi:hypothetical protein